MIHLTVYHSSVLPMHHLLFLKQMELKKEESSGKKKKIQKKEEYIGAKIEGVD